MVDIESNKPIMPSTTAPVAVNSKAYTEILNWTADPNMKVYIREIQIAVSAITTHPTFRIEIDGESKLVDYETLTTTGSLNFGDHLVFVGHKSKPTIRILCKNDATASVDVTAVVTGVEEEWNG
jgi:hypothetical protein